MQDPLVVGDLTSAVRGVLVPQELDVLTTRGLVVEVYYCCVSLAGNLKTRVMPVVMLWLVLSDRLRLYGLKPVEGVTPRGDPIVLVDLVVQGEVKTDSLGQA